MSIKTYLEGLYNYNYWANHRYLKTAESLTEEQFHRKQDNGGSVHGTLLHMMSTETIWWKRWQGEYRNDLVETLAGRSAEERIFTG